MKLTGKRFEKPTLLTVAVYFFLFAVCAKGVYFYVNQYPLKNELLAVQGTVEKVRLGGQGKSTRMKIESARGTHEYSSYYGKVWPGMERIDVGDRVDVLAERNRLNRNEWIEGKRYYLWELRHRDQVLIRYEDVLQLVQEKEAVINRYINLWLVISSLALLALAIVKIIQRLLR